MPCSLTAKQVAALALDSVRDAEKRRDIELDTKFWGSQLRVDKVARRRYLGDRGPERRIAALDLDRERRAG